MNKVGDGKTVLFEALTRTKPINGPQLQSSTGANDIDIEAFFGEIAGYKAEFAFSLASYLRDSGTTLNIPKYIADAFTFLRGDALGKKD